MNTYISLYFNVMYVLMFDCFWVLVSGGVSILETPTDSTTGAGQRACTPFFDFTAFLRGADTFYVRREKRRQMQSQYEIRAVCSLLLFPLFHLQHRPALGAGDRVCRLRGE